MVVRLRDEVAEAGGLPPPPSGLGGDAPSHRAHLLWLKHSVDTVLAVSALLVLSPLLLVIAVVVKASSPGPVLFRQQRIGRDGRPFVMLKFRSMREATAVSRFEPAMDVAPGGVEGIDRRTRVGRWLRASSLDELPQLVNVVRQEMSLVGPRPERPHFVDRFREEVDGYSLRLRVRPGITGLAQVRGLRGPTSLSRRVEADNEYIESWSLWRDVVVLWLTAWTVVAFLGRSSDEPHQTEIALVGRTAAHRHPDADRVAEVELTGERALDAPSVTEGDDAPAAVARG